MIRGGGTVRDELATHNETDGNQRQGCASCRSRTACARSFPIEEWQLHVGEVRGERKGVERVVEIPAHDAAAADELAAFFREKITHVELDRIAAAKTIPRREIPFL